MGKSCEVGKACLYVRSTVHRRYHHRGGVVKHMQACLRARNDVESSFHHSGGPVKLVQAFYVRETPYNAVFTAEEVLSSTCRPV